MKFTDSKMLMTVILTLLLCLCVNTKVLATEQMATVISGAVTNITSSGATVSGNVSSDGGNRITERGVVFATSANPGTNTGTRVTSSGTTGTFSVTLSGLRPNATYHVRAYAINSQGASYGEDVMFYTNMEANSNLDYDFYAIFNPIKYAMPSFIAGISGSSTKGVISYQNGLVEFELDIKKTAGKYLFRCRVIGSDQLKQYPTNYQYEEFNPLFSDNITLLLNSKTLTEPHTEQGANILIDNDTDLPININWQGPTQYPDSAKLAVTVNKGELQYNKQSLPTNKWTSTQTIKLIESDPNLDLQYTIGGNSLKISSDGKYIIGFRKNILKIYDKESNSLKSIDTQQSNDISSIIISPDNKLVATQYSDGTMNIWSLPDGISIIQSSPIVGNMLSFSPDSKLLIYTSNGFTIAYSLDEGKAIGQVQSISDNSYPVISPDHTKLGVYRSYKDGYSIGVYEITSGNLLYTLSPSTDGRAESSLTFSPDSNTIITTTKADSYGKVIIKVWDATTGVLKYALKDSAVFDGFLVSHDGTKLVTVLRSQGVVEYWDLNSGTLLNSFTCSNYHGMAISPDDSLLALGSDTEINIYRLSDGSLVNKSPATGLYGLGFSPNGEILAEEFSTIKKLVKTNDWTVFQTINDSRGSFFSTDSKQLIRQSDYPDGCQETWIWKVADSSVANNQDPPIYLKKLSLFEDLDSYIPILIKTNVPNRITSGSLYLDGTVISNITPTLTQSSYYAALATDFIPPGIHQISFEAVDSQGNNYNATMDCMIKKVSLNVQDREIIVDLAGDPLEVEANVLPNLENDYEFYWGNYNTDLFQIKPNGNKVEITPLKMGRGLLTVMVPGSRQIQYVVNVINSSGLVPTVSTGDVSGICYREATAGGNVVNDGGSSLIECGVVYDSSANPTIDSGIRVQANTALGTFSVLLTGLSQNTTYHARAYAMNAIGASYGNDITFTTNKSVVSSSLITTVAGNSMQGFSGDGSAAIIAKLNNPNGVAVDSAGNLFITDCYNNRVRKVSDDGIISTVAGNGDYGFSGDGGTAISAQLSYPGGLAVDSAGDLYIADASNNRIRKVDSDGIITTVAGNGTPGSGFSGDGGMATSAKLSNPVDVAVDKSGNLYIADNYNNRIRKVSTDGIITTVAGNGTLGFSGDGGAATSAKLYSPEGVAVDKSGNLYIVEPYNYRIRKVDTDGIITTVAGNGTWGYAGDGGLAINAKLKSPTGVAVDNDGNLYISDKGNNCIRKVSVNGIIMTVVGNGTSGYTGDGGTASNATLSNPSNVTIDNSGNLYIADTANNSIRFVEKSSSNVKSFAKPLVQIGVNPNDSDYVGMYVGLENITDSNGNPINSAKVAGYKIEVDYDQTKVNILDVVDEAKLGQFDINNDSSTGKLTITDSSTNGLTGYNKLFFLSVVLTGSASDLTSLQVKYLNVSDSNNKQISIEDSPALQFQRGIILNGDGSQPNINDAVAGLQYLAGLKNAGSALGEVNLINMASIIEPGLSSTLIQPSVKDVIALLQYLAGLRDDSFQIV